MAWFNQEWIAQSLGVAAFMISLVGYASTSDRHLKIMMTLGTILLAVHFVLFGTWLSAVSLAMNTARTWLSIYRRGLQWFVLVASLQLAVSMPMVSVATDLLPVAGSLVGSFGLLCLVGIRLRVAMLITTGCWLANNLLLGSIGAVMLDLLNTAAHASSIWRISRNRKTSPLR